jgi:hypothetical protein
MQWQPQGKIGWHDIQIGPPNHALTHIIYLIIVLDKI